MLNINQSLDPSNLLPYVTQIAITTVKELGSYIANQVWSMHSLSTSLTQHTRLTLVLYLHTHVL